MKSKFLVCLLAVMCLGLITTDATWAAVVATGSLKPDVIPNGATDSPSGNVYHVRFEFSLTSTINFGAGDDITITVPTGAGITFKTGAGNKFVTATNGSTLKPSVNTNTTTQFGISILQPGAVGNKIWAEVDLVTPSSYSVAEAQNFTADFAWETTPNTLNVPVSLKASVQLAYITFSGPSGNNDTTSAEGTGYKLTFPSALPDLVHDDNTKSTTNPNGSDSQDLTLVFTSNGTDDGNDMAYQFWVSTDSTLIRSTQGGTPLNILEMKATPTAPGAMLTPAIDSASPYTTTPSGLYQNPTVVPPGVINENFTNRLQDATLEGLVDTRGLTEGKYFIYISSNKTSDFFLGRSASLVVTHKPGFLGAAWDKDITASAFSTNNIVETTVDNAAADDAANITLDSGNLFDQDGTRSANEATPAGTIKDNVNLIFRAVDYDNPTARVWIFTSTNSGLTDSNLVVSGSAPNRVITGLTGARLVSRSDTLRVGARSHNFKPENLISVLSTDTTYVAEGSYTVYFAATDGTNLTLEKASDISGTLTKTPLTLAVKHSPSLTPDPLAFNDGSGTLYVETGVGNSTTAKPQRVVRIPWEQYGLAGDKDVDDNATIGLYYSDDATFTTAALLLADVGVGDTHLINRSTTLYENPDGKFDNHFDWDLWNYVSSVAEGGTIPSATTNYSIYAVSTGGSVQRLSKYANVIDFSHGSFARPIAPAKDITVGPDDPFVLTWEAADVDNEGPAAGNTGPIAANGTASPDVMLVMSPTDLGATTTYATISVGVDAFVINSTTGDDGANHIRLREGVDSSFVAVMNRLDTDIAGNAGAPPAGTYYPYIFVDNNSATNAVPFLQNAAVGFRYPGKIVLTAAPASDPTNARFIFPAQNAVASGELLRIPIIAEDGGATIRNANIFVEVDTTYFEPVDKNPASSGTQPYTLGEITGTTSAEIVGNAATRSGGKWLLDFVYVDGTTLANLFDGSTPLAYLWLRAKEVSGTVNTPITINNDPANSRQTSLYTSGGARVPTDVPGPGNVRIDARGSISGTVPLQGRASYAMPATDVAFFLRKGSLRASTATGTANQAGGFDVLDDATFTAANDTDGSRAGIQAALPATGAFTLSSVPSGDYTLVVFVDRYLAAQREVTVKPGEAVTGIQPTLDGRGVEHTFLLAGDAAGYDHDGLSTTNTRPDNFVGTGDENAIKAAIFALTLDSLYTAYPYADVNGSGKVDGVDLNYAIVNATTTNGTNDPVKPTFNLKPVSLTGTNANAAFLLASASSAVRAGETFDVAVQVKGAVAARAYEFHLGYDASKVVPEGVVATGDLLARYGVALAAKDLGGDYGVTGSAYGLKSAANGDGGLATVRFRAVQGGSAEIHIMDGFLIDSDLNVEKPKMEARIVLDVTAGPMKLHDASGAEVLGLIVLDGHAKVDFTDFFAFAEAFGSKSGAGSFNALADLNADGSVDFNDFFIFADNFGKAVVDVPTARRSSKPVGANFQGTISLAALGSVKAGEMVTLDAVLSGAAAKGIGFTVTYDAARFEFVEVAKSEQELFLARPDGEGRIAVARAAEAGLDGSVAKLVFRAKGEFEQPGRFQIADGLVLSPEGMTTQIAGNVLDLATVPASFSLAQNFPNPFNPETTIKYNLADEAQVGLRIYSILGQVVRTLVQEKQAAGRYSIRWDGRDDRGLTVSSGIYFYQVTAGSFKDVRKLMLLK